MENAYTQGLFPLVKKENLAKDVYSFTVLAPNIARAAEPGQFVHIAVRGHALRRPISICSADTKNGLFRIIFAIKGEGTRELSACSEGSCLDVSGPLGKGFTLLGKDKKVLLAGGGLGVPPMVFLSSYYGASAKAVCGFRNAAAVIAEDDFRRNETPVTVATDDGSYGVKGTVAVPLKEILSSGEKFDMIYTCGPEPMMKAVAGLAEEFSVPCEVSLERHMGCGIGACLTCACKIKRNGETEYLRACKDGPVFNAKEVW